MNALVLAALLIADGGGGDGGAPAAAASSKPEPAPPECVGGNLDLDAIIAGARCDVRDEPRPPPSPTAIGIELSPKIVKVRAGEDAQLTITFRNRTAAILPLDVDLTCEMEVVFETELYAGKKRADKPDACGIGM